MPQPPTRTAPRIPVNTYRLQLHGGLTFDDARRLLPFLERLGITDLYLSPCLAAQPGSMHGYDICDHSRLNPELGGESSFDLLADDAASRGMGIVVDFVPNHMGIDARFNPWWRDVLENGRSSRFARFFDIDWDPVKPELREKVLLPILGDRYGIVLERGELQLAHDAGRVSLRYFDHDLPLSPRQIPRVLRHGLDRLQAELPAEDPSLRELLSIITELDHLPGSSDTDPERIAERQREKEVAHDRLARLVAEAPRIRSHLEAGVAAFNGTPGKAESFDLLHDLLEAQPYRLAYWKTAFHEINYRRFFDINDLAALRMEDPAVFEATHALVLRLVGEGKITGLRLDHLDGLFDPAGYLARLQAAAGPLWVVAEKILSEGETLPTDWQVAGTTGYDFLNEVNGLFVDGRGSRRMRAVYERFTRRTAPLPIVAYVSKKLILQTSMASELTVLAHGLNRISERDRRSRDLTLETLRDALREVIACFPVYRTYVSDAGASDSDRRTILTAIERAARRNPVTESSVFAFVRETLLPFDSGLAEEERRIRLELSMRFQQFTGPVQAKGVEDTAFYRQNVLLSLNEVGGDPAHFGRRVDDFHRANLARLADRPHAMVTTATHDTKRGEDARARIDVISELPEEWRLMLARWARVNGVLRTKLHGDWAPDRNDEYLLYQTLLGAWPPASSQAPEPSLVERLGDYFQKAMREAKLHTSWVNPNLAYEQASREFLRQILTGPRAGRFLAAFFPFAERVARLGMVNSLAQLVLKLAGPGVVDTYQGTELWDLSLVDPDNRRPVDYELRERLLGELASADAPVPGTAAELLGGWPDGRVKLLVLACGLRARRADPELFLAGEYRPLEAEGERSAHVVAFARAHRERLAVAIVPRMLLPLVRDDHPIPLGTPSWGETRLRLPEDLAGQPLRNILTGQRFAPSSGSLRLDEVLSDFPVALLVSLRPPAARPSPHARSG